MTESRDWKSSSSIKGQELCGAQNHRDTENLASFSAAATHSILPERGGYCTRVESDDERQSQDTFRMPGMGTSTFRETVVVPRCRKQRSAGPYPFQTHPRTGRTSASSLLATVAGRLLQSRSGFHPHSA